MGIAKRCHEIANSRQDELQARLESDGSIPKKSDFIEIMMNIWKDSMRILGKKFIGGHILDCNSWSRIRTHCNAPLPK